MDPISPKIRCQWITPEDSQYPAMLSLRENVLRKPLGQQMTPEDYAQDKDHHLLVVLQVTHSSYLEGEEVVGCLVLQPLDDHTLQMRQVAVSPQVQGQGIGRLMVRASEEFILTHGLQKKITLNARSTVMAFYQGLGYHTVGDPFELIGIPHQRMEKQLSSSTGPAHPGI